jgi:hypothetical protein
MSKQFEKVKKKIVFPHRKASGALSFTCVHMYICTSHIWFLLNILSFHNVYKNFIYELNKRIDEIKNHSMNNSFLYAMKKKINSS